MLAGGEAGRTFQPFSTSAWRKAPGGRFGTSALCDINPKHKAEAIRREEPDSSNVIVGGFHVRG